MRIKGSGNLPRPPTGIPPDSRFRSLDEIPDTIPIGAGPDHHAPIGPLLNTVADRTASYVLPTEYGGITYRSRTEARWAVLFDTLEIKFQYEPEGFNLGGLWYLPDFYIPTWDIYIEVKGAGITLSDTERRKAQGCADASEKAVLAVFGDPSLDRGQMFFPPPHEEGPSDLALIRNCRNCDLMVAWCEWSNGYGSHPLGRCGEPDKCSEKSCADSIGQKLEIAIKAARACRFDRKPAADGVEIA